MKKIMFYTVLMLQVCISVYADDFDQHLEMAIKH